jgi:hypothetical protein
MDWITAKQASSEWGITIRRVQVLCENGQVEGATKLADIWVIPKDAPKPIDGRTKTAKLLKRVFEYPEAQSEKLMVAEENNYYRESNS